MAFPNFFWVLANGPPPAKFTPWLKRRVTPLDNTHYQTLIEFCFYFFYTCYCGCCPWWTCCVLIGWVLLSPSHASKFSKLDFIGELQLRTQPTNVNNTMQWISSVTTRGDFHSFHSWDVPSVYCYQRNTRSFESQYLGNTL